MKQLIILGALLFSALVLTAQQTITESITHDNGERSYIIYLPASYDGTQDFPLVLNFHGYGSNATEQMFYGDFRPIADTANFIIVHPQGLLYSGSTHWNVGGFTEGSTVDDVGFVDDLLDSLDAKYSIDSDRVYSTGMSNGGYMSFLLACQLSDRIAAVASVTGAMSPSMYNNCTPSHPMPVMQIHGTNDPVVPFAGAMWTVAIPEVLLYWKDFNQLADAVISDVDDGPISDGTTADHYQYADASGTILQEHFRIENGQHTWPGTFFSTPGTNYDIDGSEEVWRFFSQFDLQGSIVSTNSVDITPGFAIVNNPTSDFLQLANTNQGDTYSIIRVNGSVILSGELETDHTTIDVSQFQSGVYYIQVGKTTKKFIKQ